MRIASFDRYYLYRQLRQKRNSADSLSGLDIESAPAGSGAVTDDQFGAIHIYDLKSGKEAIIARAGFLVSTPGPLSGEIIVKTLE